MSPLNDHVASTIEPSRGERLFILPYNRRLKHIHGVSIRNIDLESIAKRHRGQTIDDAGLIGNLQSPAKILASREAQQLTHARSSGDLRSPNSKKQQANGGAIASNGSPKPPKIQRPRKPRRRSTMDWVSTTQSERLAKFQDAVSQHCVDSFFSIHLDAVEEPVYISEIVLGNMNPDFKEVDLAGLCASQSRCTSVTIKAWIRTDTEDDWRLHIAQETHLPSLEFLGRSLDRVTRPLSENVLLIHMTDGIYISTEHDFSRPSQLSALAASDISVQCTRSSTYDALMRLGTLDDAIRDALATRRRLESEISHLIDVTRTAMSTRRSLDGASTSTSRVTSALDIQHQKTQVARRQLDHVRANLIARRQTMSSVRAEQGLALQSQGHSRAALVKTQSAHKAIRESIINQRRRICADLTSIYPIEPLLSKPLSFQIRSLPLPNSTFSADVRQDVVSAALGHVAHLVHLLSFYLACPLPYPIQASSSSSFVLDPISLTIGGNRHFSLQLGGRGGNIFYRFEYAVFLLNKDIQALAAKLGLRLPDIRQTLPNLKYIFAVTTAEGGEIAQRKIRGVEGLVRGGIGSELASPAASDVGSLEYVKRAFVKAI